MIHYKFKNTKLLQEALTHPSLCKGKNRYKKNYERLEFLGDSILGMVIADLLFMKYAKSSEGGLAVKHSNLVNTKCISQIAESINLGDMLYMDEGEIANGGRKNPRTLENAMEALIGAIYIDSDYYTVRSFIEKFWAPLIERESEISVRDNKSLLQEWAQKRGKPIPEYCLLKKEGVEHSPIFTVLVTIDSVSHASAHGRSKKEAEHNAARQLLKIIQNEQI